MSFHYVFVLFGAFDSAPDTHGRAHGPWSLFADGRWTVGRGHTIQLDTNFKSDNLLRTLDTFLPQRSQF